MRAVACLAVLLVLAPLRARAEAPPEMVPVDDSSVPLPPHNVVPPPPEPPPPIFVVPITPPPNTTLRGSVLIGFAIGQVPWIIAGATLLGLGVRSYDDTGTLLGYGLMLLGPSMILALVLAPIGLHYYLSGLDSPEEKAKRGRLKLRPMVAPMAAGPHSPPGGMLGVLGAF